MNQDHSKPILIPTAKPTILTNIIQDDKKEKEKENFFNKIYTNAVPSNQTISTVPNVYGGQPLKSI